MEKNEQNEQKLKSLIEEMIDAKGGEKVEDKAKEEAKPSEVEVDINNLDFKEVAQSIVEALREEKGGDDKDAAAAAEKIYNEKGGLKAIKYPALKELDNLSDDEKLGCYFKALFTPTLEKTADDMAVLKALSEGVAADGGNLVPTPLANEVDRIRNDIAIMRQIASVREMTSQTLKITSDASAMKSYWIGEKETKTTTSAEFEQKTLTANKLVTRLRLTEELNDDSIIAMIPYLSERFAESIAQAEDKAFFTGNGTGRPRGISIETINSTNVGGTLNFDRVIDLKHSVPQSVRKSRNTAYVANSVVIQKLMKVKDNDGAYIWQGRNTPTTGTPTETIYGQPIYEQNDLADSELYYGDWSKYIIGDRKQLSIRATDIAGDAWARDLWDVKAVERVDGRANLLTAFAKLTNI